MYAKLLSLLLIACQIIFNGSHVISETTGDIPVISVNPTPPPIIDANGYARFPDINAAYKVYEVEKTWYQARELCISEGARLAITDSVEKIAHVRSLKENWVPHWLTVGIHHLNATNQWVRADNDLPLSSIPWAEDNPEGEGECVGISPTDDEVGDYDCEAEAYYVCEITL